MDNTDSLGEMQCFDFCLFPVVVYPCFVHCYEKEQELVLIVVELNETLRMLSHNWVCD